MIYVHFISVINSDYYNKEQIDEALENLSQNLKAGKYHNFSNKFSFIYAYVFENIYVIN